MGLLTNRTNNKLERSNLINEHVLSHEHVPLNRICLGVQQNHVLSDIEFAQSLHLEILYYEQCQKGI